MLASLGAHLSRGEDPHVLDLAAHGGDRLDDAPPLRGRLARPAAGRRSTGDGGQPARPARSRCPGEAGSGPLPLGRPGVPAAPGDLARRSSALVEPAPGQGEQVLDRLLGLGPGGPDLDLVPVQGARVATRLRLPAGTGPAPVVRLRSGDGRVEPADLADQPGGRSGVQAVGVVDREDADDLLARRRLARAATVASVGADRCAALPISASRASAATSARLAPPAAATAATMRPSTMGAGDSVTRSRTAGRGAGRAPARR